MMKTTFKWLTTALLLFLSLAIQAQPDWQWGKRGGSNSSDGEQVIDMATDQNGNVYVLAKNGGSGIANVDGHTGIGLRDRLSVASWSCDGEFRWMKTIGSDGGAVGEAIHVDSLGGVYVAGEIASPGYFDTDTVLPAINKRMYLIKYDTGGNYQWLKMPQPDTITTGANYSVILDMDGTPNGDLYLYTLLIPGLYDSGAFAVTDTGMYIWKMNKDGVFQSLTRLDVTVSGPPNKKFGYANLLGAHFKRDHYSGRYYLTGTYYESNGTIQFGSTAIDKMIYVAAFNSAGASIWAKQQDELVGGAWIKNRPQVADSHIFIGGYATSGNSFGGYTFVNEFGPSSVPFIVALDTNGNTIWATNASAHSGTIANPLLYSNSSINQAGMYGNITWQGITVSSVPGKNYVYLARFNATTGAIIGLDSLATGGLTNEATAMTADKNGNLFVGGSFDASITVAGNTLYKTGGPSDWFVAKFGTANCNCTIPTANFAYAASGTAINFSYTGSTDYSSISWDFGDGTTATTANPTHTFSDTASHTVCVTVTNDCGSNVYCLEVTAPTGIESAMSAAAVKVYPNPTTNSIIVEGAGSGTKLLLYEVTGKLALEQTLRNSRPVNLNISHLPDGIYLLQFTDSKGRKGMTKVVKR